ncbi:MAG TPA: hypothetical protein VGQ81_06605 [Acidobacteriota bacterium]|jgi:hypothetical protein|nr:hypothetical protein [Acidobacteriota bacterium]
MKIYRKAAISAAFFLLLGSLGYAASARVTRGTELTLRLHESISSKDNRVGDRFSTTVISPGQFNGATVTGHIASIRKSGKFKGRTTMTLAFDNIRYADGITTPYRGEVVKVYESEEENASKVDQEGHVESGKRGEQTLKRSGIGAAAGATIGAITGGAKGAAIGMIIGGAAGAGSMMIQGSKELEMKPGTEILVRTLSTSSVRRTATRRS